MSSGIFPQSFSVVARTDHLTTKIAKQLSCKVNFHVVVQLYRIQYDYFTISRSLNVLNHRFSKKVHENHKHDLDSGFNLLRSVRGDAEV